MRSWTALALGAVTILSAPGVLSADDPPGEGDWPRYARDLAGTRFSPLTQINTENVARLRQAWSFQVRPVTSFPAANSDWRWIWQVGLHVYPQSPHR